MSFQERLIPAHAGKTVLPRLPSADFAAHPRSRGENLRRALQVQAHGGSSPLTRGKRNGLRLARDPMGLIPAHAGKTLEELVNTWQARAHPRSRGENFRSLFATFPLVGSSPLTRGKRDLTEVTRGGQGLIPAHAGKTTASPPQHRPSWAHPRSRGENNGVASAAPSILGSSPLTRGKRRETRVARF